MAVLVFAKPPVPGKVKTRLIGRLSAGQAAEVHRACLADTVGTVSGVPGCRKWLLVAGHSETAARLGSGLDLTSRWRTGIQHGSKLGARLREAFQSCFRSGYNRVVIVGTDTPWMGSNRILRALQSLREADVVLGPAEDGGYYLVGARRLVPEMFRDIPWGTAQVLRQTLAATQKAGASWVLLPRDFDLDRPEDFQRAAQLLRKQKKQAPALAKWIRDWELDRSIESSPRRQPVRRSRTRRPGRA